MTCPAGDQEYTLALKYEAMNDLEDIGNTAIEEIIGVGVSSGIAENTRLTLNYENQNFDNDPIPGGGYAHVWIAELSIGF